MEEPTDVVFGLAARVRELELWGKEMNGSVKRMAREQERIANLVEGELLPAVRELVKKDEIEEAVGLAVKKQKKMVFTGFEKFVGLMVSLASVGGLVIAILAYSHHGG